MEKTNKNSRKYIIAGAGEDGRYICKAIGENNVICFADKDCKKVGQLIFGKEIISYEELAKKYNNDIVVISSIKYKEEIREILIYNGIKNIISANELLLKNAIFSIKNNNSKKRIFLLNSHDGINIGDMLISISELYFFKKYLPDYNVVEIPTSGCLDSIQALKDIVEDNDILVISGGGYMGSLWVEGGEANIRKIILNFPKNKIYVFPQTLFFENNENGKMEIKKSKEIYNRHSNLVLSFRDEESYELSQEIFSDKIFKYYIPDVVTLIDKSFDVYERHGVTFCLREDKEKVFGSNQIRETMECIFEKKLEDNNISMILNHRPQLSERMDIINNLFVKIQKSELVVTDRLHCMLACAVSGTPCIAFDNISRKVRGTYRWIKNNAYVCFFESLEDALKNKDIIKKLKPGVYNRNKVIEGKYIELAEKIRIGSDGDGR